LANAPRELGKAMMGQGVPAGGGLNQVFIPKAAHAAETIAIACCDAVKMALVTPNVKE
jgi:hypothetical protein